MQWRLAEGQKKVSTEPWKNPEARKGMDHFKIHASEIWGMGCCCMYVFKGVPRAINRINHADNIGRNRGKKWPSSGVGHFVFHSKIRGKREFSLPWPKCRGLAPLFTVA